MLKLFRRLFNDGVDRQVLLLRRDASSLTVNEWRKNGDLLQAARKVLEQPDMRLMLDTIRNTHFYEFDLIGNHPIEQRAIRQAESSGFALAIKMLKSLGEPLPSQEMPEATFDAPELPQID